MASNTTKAIWIHRLLRLGFGLSFLSLGIYFRKEEGWPMILFGLLIFGTAFFRPRRCIDSGDSCSINQ
jgi:hypothetical protein